MANSSPKQPLKIGIDGRELLPNVTVGFGRFLANFLTSQVVQNSPHQYFIYGQEDTQFQTYPNQEIIRLKSEGKPTMWWDQVILARQLKKEKTNLLFTPYDKAPILSPCPVILTVHDLLYHYFSHLTGFKKTLYNGLYKIQRGLMARRATHVLTVSQYSKEDIIRFYKLPADKITVCYNTVADSFLNAVDDTTLNDIKTKYNLDKPFILNLTNFKPHKNPICMLEGFAYLKSQTDTKIQLVMAGAFNAFTESIQSKAQTMGIADQVTFIDRPSDEELHALYKEAKIFAYPSLYEGFGIPPLEAMTCGTPVVVSNTSSLPEVVGDAGLLVSPTDPKELGQALIQLLTDVSLYKRCQQTGIEQSQTFTTEAFAKTILSTIETVGYHG